MKQNKLRNINTLFFDLDGTLLDLSDENFEKVYAYEAAMIFKDIIDPKIFVKLLIESTVEMMKSRGEKLLIDVFYEFFCPKVGLKEDEVQNRFLRFYETSFDKLKLVSKRINGVPDLIRKLNDRGYKLVLATQPFFYELATIKRIRWAGLEPDQFLYFTHIENSSVAKPNPLYFEQLANITKSKPEEILMIGNDYLYDLSAKKLGISTWMTPQNQSNLEYKDKMSPDFELPLLELLDFLP